MKRVIAFLLVATLSTPSVGLAQEQPVSQPPSPAESRGPQSSTSSQASDQQSAASVDAGKLGVSLDRIRRELRQSEPTERTSGSPLKLEFVVEVYGKAPRIDFLKDFPLTGPVPGTAPTHREVIDFLTPQEFRAPAIPFYGMAVWAAQKLWEKSKKSRCEQEIAEYKLLVMQGVAVPAPRCTQ